MKEEITKTAGVILATATLVSGGFLLTTEDKTLLEQEIKELEDTRFIKAERIVDQQEVPVFETHGEVDKVIINGQEYLPK